MSDDFKGRWPKSPAPASNKVQKLQQVKAEVQGRDLELLLQTQRTDDNDKAQTQPGSGTKLASDCKLHAAAKSIDNTSLAPHSRSSNILAATPRKRNASEEIAASKPALKQPCTSTPTKTRLTFEEIEAFAESLHIKRYWVSQFYVGDDMLKKGN